MRKKMHALPPDTLEAPRSFLDHARALLRRVPFIGAGPLGCPGKDYFVNGIAQQFPQNGN